VRRPVVAVAGSSRATEALASLARRVGAGLARRGAVVVTGGLGGVMEAASEGARSAGGLTIGILPGADRREANRFVEIALPTGLGEARNVLVALAGEALVAIGGGTGTLSEVALALRAGVRVVGLEFPHSVEGILRAGGSDEAVDLALGASGTG
jgi:hypothetical protein